MSYTVLLPCWFSAIHHPLWFPLFGNPQNRFIPKTREGQSLPIAPSACSCSGQATTGPCEGSTSPRRFDGCSLGGWGRWDKVLETWVCLVGAPIFGFPCGFSFKPQKGVPSKKHTQIWIGIKLSFGWVAIVEVDLVGQQAGFAVSLGNASPHHLRCHRRRGFTLLGQFWRQHTPIFPPMYCTSIHGQQQRFLHFGVFLK